MEKTEIILLDALKTLWSFKWNYEKFLTVLPKCKLPCICTNTLDQIHNKQLIDWSSSYFNGRYICSLRDLESLSQCWVEVLCKCCNVKEGGVYWKSILYYHSRSTKKRMEIVSKRKSLVSLGRALKNDENERNGCVKGQHYSGIFLLKFRFNSRK